eukprot:m.443080 g.443080  ORF g.443080 m.443080 type:complete len:184 (-) comp20291_c0_seq1:108-659(-)
MVLFAASGRDKSVLVYDYEDGERFQLIKRLRGHGGVVRGVDFHPTDNDRLVTASYDHTVRLWDIEAERCVASLDAHEAEINSVKFHPQGEVFCSVSDDHVAKIWSHETRKWLHTLSAHKKIVINLDFSSDGELLATCSSDGTVCLWDVSTGTLAANVEAHRRSIMAVSFSPGAQVFATASQDR